MIQIIRDAAAVYELPRWQADQLVAVAGCETGGTYDPWSVGDSGRSHGLFQFHRGASGWSLWDVTPYAHESPYDPWSASLAASWAWTQGLQNHWSCYNRIYG